ncbi:MAG: CHRD domain-containing protein [Candidatus Rokuibacteriota bacterium]
MNGYFRALVAAAGLLVLLVPTAGQTDDNRHLHSTLSGFNEVHGPGIGAIFSTGSGQIKLKTDKQDREIHFELTYAFPDASDTPVAGTQFVNQAHLHFGQKHTTGGITVWLCKSEDVLVPPQAADSPTCLSPSGTVKGIIRPQNVIGLAGQGLPGGEDGFDALLAALRTGAVYANVHTDRFGAGEIRGQLDHDHDDD